MNEQTIKLKPNEYSLSEVVVSGQRELFKSRGTDIVADIQHSNLRDFGFADDIIDKLPMVSGEHGSYNILAKEAQLFILAIEKYLTLLNCQESPQKTLLQ